MDIYLIEQEVNTDYDTYDSAVVTAETEEQALHIHPNGTEDKWDNNTWCKPEEVMVTLIGTTETIKIAGVICASFNAG